jgi:transcription antitermination factor NusG
MNEMWKSLYSVRGISKVIIGPEERPILVSDHIIHQIKIREEYEMSSRFLPGQLVIPNTGHLAGVTGKFDKTTQRDREVALFDILGSEVRVEFAPGILSPGEQDQQRKKRGGKKHNRSELVGSLN